MRIVVVLLLAACSGEIAGTTDGGTDSGPLIDAPVDCKAALAFYGVTFTEGGASPGIADPITAQVPIGGITYRVLGANNPRQTLYGDCTLVRSLAEAAPIFAARGIVEVADLGIYNYRCIGGGAPPNSPKGISQHAYAKAIDIAGVTTTTGDFFSVNDDWVIDPNAQETCMAPAEPGKDQFLHELICALKAARVWNIVLTPNYNADHRNHFHVDLTPESDFIELRH
ncbi:MAG: extensin family protein [Kofleriaceae bacterium]